MRSLVLAFLSSSVMLAQPTVGNVNPNGGNGSGFTFTLTVSDPVAATNIGYTDILFNTGIDGTNACYLHYDQAGGVIYLRDDTQPSWIDSGAPATPATLRNSQCSLDLNAASAVASGLNLVITLPLTFAPGFAGAKNIYAIAANDSLDSGWQSVGAWTVTSSGGAISVSLAPSGVTLAPTQTQQFTPTVTGDPTNAVNWSIAPNGVGIIDNTGLYTAPPAVSSQQTVSVRATSIADSSRFATATVTLTPPAPGPRPISIYNTGVLSPGVLASQFAPDSHYSLVNSADPGFPGPNAFIVDSYPVGNVWMANGPQSKWIAPQSAVANGLAAGGYVYRTTFDLTGLDPSTAVLNGQFASDNVGSIQLNHADVGPSSSSATAFTPFTISSGFVPGLNTLDFLVTNGAADTTGLRVEISGTASPLASGVTVTVNPSSPAVYPSQSLQFAASVTGSSNTGVTWSVTPAGTGSISGSGLYIAPPSITDQQSVTIRATSAADPTRSAIAYLSLNPAPGAFPPIRVNVGGDDYTDPQGRLWSHDYNVTGGGVAGTSGTILGTDAQALYQTLRYGDSTWAFRVPDGSYTVKLKFCNLFDSGPGRLFNVLVNGSTVLANFDIIVAAGAPNTAVDRSFTVNVSTHQIVIQTQIVSYNALISGIEIVPISTSVDVQVDQGPVSLFSGQTQQFTAWVGGSPNTAVNWSLSPPVGTISQTGFYVAPAGIATQQTVTVQASSAADPSRTSSVFVTLNPPPTSFVPIRVNSGGFAYADPQGKQWSADYGYTQSGGAALSANAIAGTTAPLLYQSLRFGETVYTFPLPNGQYNVTLKFAEIFLSGAGRVSNIYINGTLVLPNFDIFVAAGAANTAVDRTFVVVVTNGQIVIQSTIQNYGPIINGIEITQATNVTLSPTSVNLTAGQTAQFAAVVTPAGSGVNWSISGAGAISITGLYTAPAVIDGPQTVTVIATNAGDTSKTATAIVSLIPFVTLSGAGPDPAQAGADTVTLTAINFPTGNVTASAITVRLEPATAGAGPTVTTQATSITPLGSGTALLAFVPPTSIAVTAPTPYLASISGQTSLLPITTGAKAQFTVNPPAAISSVSPNSARAGQLTSVTITGSWVNFVQGTTQASFGSGIAVGGGSAGSFGPVTVTSPTTAVASVLLSSSTTLGTRTVMIKTGAAQATLTNGFTVLQALPVVTFTSPQNLTFTNTSPVTVFGTVSDSTAQVTVNGIAAPFTPGSFSLTVPLVEGNNTVTAVARTSTGLAGEASVEITLDTTPPRVTVNSPADSFTTTASTITVSGTVNDLVVGTVNDQQATVQVNGATAQVANRSFVAPDVPLALGDNTIQVVGRDRVGNSSTSTLIVHRVSPTQPEVRIVSGGNQTAAISAQVANPLVVTLVDAGGIPQVNQPVVLKVTQNNGSLAAVGTAVSSYQLGSLTVSVVVNTNSQGQASVRWTLGSRSGAGANRVEASATGYSGPAVFSATGTPTAAAQINVDAGSGQTGATGTPLPNSFVVVLTDAGHNRLANVPVTFTVTQGGGNIGGQTSVIRNTDSDGRALAVLTLGLQEGIETNRVQATFPGNTGAIASFSATGLAPGDPASTSISGVVLDNTDTPIQGVTMRLYQPYQGQANNVPIQVAAVQTDAQGLFTIQPSPVGKFKVMADGGTAQRTGSWPTVEFDLVTVAGRNNKLDLPIYLLPLDSTNQLCVTGTTGGTLTLPQVPGFSLTVAPGSVTFPGGSRTGCVSVTPVHIDKVPMVPGFGQQPRFVVTIQPAGAIFNPPAALTMPNVDGLKPREVTELYSFDHDLSAFVAIGTGSVSNDGSVVKSDTGVGVLKAGWHCDGQPRTTGDAQNVSVTLFPAEIHMLVGDTISLTAMGQPPIGQYSWSLSGNNPDSFSLPSKPSCPGADKCIATVSALAAGSAVAQVAFQVGQQRPTAQSSVKSLKIDILDNNNSITANQTRIVGQQINLTAVVTAWPGAVVDDTTKKWVIPGSTVKSYIQTQQMAKKMPLDPRNDLMQKDSVTFYWINAGTGLQVTFSVVVDQQTYTKVVVFDVLRPTSISFNGTTNVVQISSNLLGAGISSLSLGTTGADGIDFNMAVTTPSGGDGQIGVTQLINSSRTYTFPSSPAQTKSTNSNYVLDDAEGIQMGSSPIPGAQRASGMISNDTPALPLSGPNLLQIGSAKASESFHTYFMYRPSGSNSIWVTLAELDWSWQGSAVSNASTFGLGTDPQPRPTAPTTNTGRDDISLPEWNSAVSAFHYQ